MNERPETEQMTDLESDDLARVIRAAGRRPMPPQGDYDAVFAAAHGAWQMKLRSRRRRFVAYAAAACVLVALGAALLWPLGGGNIAPVATVRLVSGDVAVFSVETGMWAPLEGAASAPTIATGDRVRTARGAGVELELVPGTSVRLAESTELAIGAANRLRLVAGTAYVDTGAATRDLQFETSLGTLRDIGTQFEVRMSETGLRVRVRSGRVELRPSSGSRQLANAEEQLELRRDGLVARTPFPATDARWSWAEQLAVIPLPRGRAHVEYLTWIAAETGRELRFETESARLYAQTYMLDGDPSGYAPTALLEIIERSSRLEAHRSDDTRTMLVGLRDIR